MTLQEFRERAQKQYHKIGVTSFIGFIEKCGYSRDSLGTTFYANGVGRRAISYLQLLESMDVAKK